MARQESQDNYILVEKSLDQMLARLLSLEISLEKAARYGAVNKRDFINKESRLKKVRKRLKVFREILREKENSQSNAADFGLPNLNTCSFEELKICDHFLTERLCLGQDLENHFNKLNEWLEAAKEGKTTGMSGTFRLSKLKKLKDELETENFQLDQDTKILQEMENVLQQDQAKKIGSQHLGDLHTFIKLYRELDNQTAKVLQLQEKVKQAEYQIIQMKEWLNENEMIKSEILSEPPPPLQALQEAQVIAKTPTLNLGAKTRERLKATRTFVDSQIGALPDLVEDNKKAPPVVSDKKEYKLSDLKKSRERSLTHKKSTTNAFDFVPTLNKNNKPSDEVKDMPMDMGPVPYHEKIKIPDGLPELPDFRRSR